MRTTLRFLLITAALIMALHFHDIEGTVAAAMTGGLIGASVFNLLSTKEGTP